MQCVLDFLSRGNFRDPRIPPEINLEYPGAKFPKMPSLISHPSVYHFRKKSTQFGSNWVLFTIICPINPIYIIWAPRLWWTPPPDRYTKFREKVPQKVGTYVNHVNVRTPPPPGLYYMYWCLLQLTATVIIWQF